MRGLVNRREEYCRDAALEASAFPHVRALDPFHLGEDRRESISREIDWLSRILEPFLQVESKLFGGNLSAFDDRRVGENRLDDGLVLAFVAGRLLLRDESRRRRWHGALLRLPLVGRLIRGVNAARFADTLGILTASGVPLLASLQSAAAVLTNLPMRAAVDEAVRRVREGGALAPALGAAKLFPPIVIHLIASGEATGRLDTMLARAAEAQSRELVNWTRGLTALLGPLLIVAMGGIVLFLVVAILLPIFEMNQLVR